MNLNRGSNLFFEALMFVFDLGVAIKPKEPELEIFFKDRNGNGIPYKKGKASMRDTRLVSAQIDVIIP